MKLIIRSIIVTSIIFLTSACTNIAPLDFTVQDVGPIENRKDAEVKSITVGFATQSQQKEVDYNHEMPPIWKESLTDALNRSLAFRDDTELKVNVSVRIIEADAPSFGASMTTTVGAIYEIVDRETGDMLMAETITTEGAVPFDYALHGLVRAREAVNRAVRNNIAEFINRLELADFSKPVFPSR
ncbi:MAG: hypothetical protein V7742_21600 [Halioglobus sp.]